MIDVGSYGKNNDSGVFANSKFGQALRSENLNLPLHQPLPGALRNIPMPYVFIGDEGFPLLPNLLRPYGGRGHSEDQKVAVENAFGILAARWRVFHSKIAVLPETTIKIVQACCVLHNFLQSTSTPAVIQRILPTDLALCEGLQAFNSRGNRNSDDAAEIRDQFTAYSMNEGQVPWQMDIIRRGQFTE